MFLRNLYTKLRLRNKMIPWPKRFFSVMGRSVSCFAFTGMSPGYGFSAKGPGELRARGDSSFLIWPKRGYAPGENNWLFFPVTVSLTDWKHQTPHFQILTCLSNVSDAVPSFKCKKIFFYCVKISLCLHDWNHFWLLIHGYYLVLVRSFHVHHF